MHLTSDGTRCRIIASMSCLPRALSSLSTSNAVSKWSSIARLPRPVMNTSSVMPAATASSTAYWINGLSTTGSISFGLALVAGRNRVPMPATGNTALVITFIATSFIEQCQQTCLIQYGNAELVRFLVFATGIGAGNKVIGFLGYAAADFAAH